MKVVHLFLSRREWQSCMKGSAFILIAKLVVIHCLSISSSSTMFISKKVGSCYAFFQGYYNYLYRMSARSHPFFQRRCTFFWRWNLLPSNFTNALSFSVFQKASHRGTNFLSKQLYFQDSIDHTEMRATTWSSYLFVEITFSEYLECLEQPLLANK